MIAAERSDRTPFLFAFGLGGLIAIALAWLPPLTAAAVCIGTGIALLMFFNPVVGLMLVVPALTLSPDIPVLGVATQADAFLMVPLTLGWLARVAVYRHRERTVLDQLLIAYVIIAAIATVWGGYLGTAHFNTLNKYISAPFHLLKRLEFVVLFFILVDTLRTQADVRRFTYVLMGAMIALSAFGYGQFLANRYIAAGPPGAPGHEPGLASMLNIILALCLMPAAKPSGRLVLGGIILFSLAVLPLSLGRNFTSSTMLVVLFIALFQQRWILAAAPAVVAAGTLIYPSHVLQRIGTLAHLFSLSPGYGPDPVSGASLFYRLYAPGYYAVLSLAHSPVLGFGLASVPLGYIDSEYATQIFYTGLAGFAVFLLFGGRLLKLAYQARKAARDPMDVGLSNAFLMLLVAFALSSFFNASVSAARTGGPFIVIAALVAVLHRRLTPSRDAEAPAAYYTTSR